MAKIGRYGQRQLCSSCTHRQTKLIKQMDTSNQVRGADTTMYAHTILHFIKRHETCTLIVLLKVWKIVTTEVELPGISCLILPLQYKQLDRTPDAHLPYTNFISGAQAKIVGNSNSEFL